MKLSRNVVNIVLRTLDDLKRLPEPPVNYEHVLFLRLLAHRLPPKFRNSNVLNDILQKSKTHFTNVKKAAFSYNVDNAEVELCVTYLTVDDQLLTAVIAKFSMHLIKDKSL